MYIVAQVDEGGLGSTHATDSEDPTADEVVEVAAEEVLVALWLTALVDAGVFVDADAERDADEETEALAGGTPPSAVPSEGVHFGFMAIHFGLIMSFISRAMLSEKVVLELSLRWTVPVWWDGPVRRRFRCW